jgi:GGDEF domain-containing protein
VPDEIDPTLPPKPSRPRRTRKFALPDHHYDERHGDRTDERIEAFLTTRPTRRRRPAPSTRMRRPIELETRPDWLTALRHEAARQERYGRPASVLFIELVAHTDELARCVADTIRAEERETDRAVRYASTSFRLLLPETGDRAARAVAQRIDQAVGVRAAELGAGAGVSIDVVSLPGFDSLEEAVADAERRVAKRTNGSNGVDGADLASSPGARAG